MDSIIPEGDYKRLGAEIAKEDSPVGIDAKHTHILILHKLEAIERHLELLETKVEALTLLGGSGLGLGMDGLGLGLRDIWGDEEDFEEEDEDPDRIIEAMLETVETQLSDKNPPATQKTLDRLISEEGIEEEEAKEMIATVLYKEMIEVISQGQDFNEFRYIQSLHRLPVLPDFEEE